MIQRARREFDGVICFGGVDWWYHNRGHYDLRLTRLLARRVPVLFVNSLGMRMPGPGEGSMFLRRVSRKLRSVARGLVEVEPGFHVLSPPYVPAGRAEALLRRVLAARVRGAAAKLGMRSPLVWVACPTAARVAFELGAAGVLFQRTDRFEAFDPSSEGAIGADCQLLLERADLSVYCARNLMAEEDQGRALFLDHGVDVRAFVGAGAERRPLPPGLAQLADDPRPRVGFVGGLDAHTFDLALFREVAARLDDHRFVLVGSSSFPKGSFDLANITRVPQVAPEAVPDYLAACDVLIMPWGRNPWIADCNPVKLKEYLAVGRPVVTTPFAELAHYEGLVEVADEPAAFASAVRAASRSPFDPSPGRERVAGQTWEAKELQLLETLESRGLVPGSGVSMGAQR